MIAAPFIGLLTFFKILPHDICPSSNVALIELFQCISVKIYKNAIFANPPPATIPIDDIDIMRVLVLSDICNHNIFSDLERKQNTSSPWSPRYYKWLNGFTIMIYIILFAILFALIKFIPQTNTWVKDTLLFSSLLLISLFLSLNIEIVRLALRIKWRDGLNILRLPLGLIVFCIFTLYINFQFVTNYIMNLAIQGNNFDFKNEILVNALIALGLFITLGLSVNYFKTQVRSMRLKS